MCGVTGLARDLVRTERCGLTDFQVSVCDDCRARIEQTAGLHRRIAKEV